MRISTPQSHLRFPLTRLLGQGGSVRVLRALTAYGAPLSVSQLSQETGLSPPGVRAVLDNLVDQQAVVPLGSGKSQVFTLREGHPLLDALKQLFAAEKSRWENVVDALRSALKAQRSVVAAWYYGSVARGSDEPRSDLDVAVVVQRSNVDRVLATLRNDLESAERSLLFTTSLIGLSTDDVLRLSKSSDAWWRELQRDAKILVGGRPQALASRLQRQATVA